MVMVVDEFLSSQTCPDPECMKEQWDRKDGSEIGCATFSTSFPRPANETDDSLPEDSMVYGEWVELGDPHYGHLMCTRCKTVFERDYVGTSDILKIGLFLLRTGLHLNSPFVDKVLGITRIGGKKRARAAAKRKAGLSSFLHSPCSSLCCPGRSKTDTDHIFLPARRQGIGGQA